MMSRSNLLTLGTTFTNFGGNKGLEVITSSRTQLLLGVPTYTLQSPNGPPGGFGDLPLMLKFRIASAEPGEGNYLLTFLLGATAPTGSHRYGAGDAVLSPTLVFGKGWGRFDEWNTALQYQAAWMLWPELEVNSPFMTRGRMPATSRFS